MPTHKRYATHLWPNFVECAAAGADYLDGEVMHYLAAPFSLIAVGCGPANLRQAPRRFEFNGTGSRTVDPVMVLPVNAVDPYRVGAGVAHWTHQSEDRRAGLVFVSVRLTTESEPVAAVLRRLESCARDVHYSRSPSRSRLWAASARSWPVELAYRSIISLLRQPINRIRSDSEPPAASHA